MEKKIEIFGAPKTKMRQKKFLSFLQSMEEWDVMNNREANEKNGRDSIWVGWKNQT